MRDAARDFSSIAAIKADGNQLARHPAGVVASMMNRQSGLCL
jgi:hypothetical protein